MDMSNINWLAVLVAGISAFVIGGIWYSPGLFGKAWMKQNSLTEDDIKRSNKGRTFGWSFILILIMSVNLAMFLADPKTDFVWGMAAGFLAGIWVFCGIAVTSMFELRSWKYVFINGGYQIVALTIMGGIIGVWR